MPAPRLLAVAALALLSACERRADVGPVVVSAIDGRLAVGDSTLGGRPFAARLMTDSVAQGLVRFDAAGQIEPGIAERWIVIDDGRSYIFRLRDAQWQDGRTVTAADVITILRRQLSPTSRNPLRPYLSAIDSVVEMTPEVIEIQLSRPRPDLLNLFAQPELAVFRTRPPGGGGPFRIASWRTRTALLTPAADPARSPDEVRAPEPEQNVRLIAERPARALVRFAARQSDLVSGGTFRDWPLLRMTDIAPVNIKLDPAAGLFGLTIADRSGVFAEQTNRAAVAAALDREEITNSFAADWPSIAQTLPAQLDSAAPPVIPAWTALPLATRRADAARRIAEWLQAHPGGGRVRVALPDGPGATILWGRIATTLIALRLTPERVAAAAPAELRLIDAVAPYDSARWYLAKACETCGDPARQALEAARLADTLVLRGQAIAAADAVMADDVAFIPIARPLRWSLVATRLRAWQANARAWHPLNRLRRDTN